MMICSKRFLKSVSGTYKFIRVTRKGLQEKGLQSRSATSSLLIKKLSVHEGRNIASCSPGPEKQAHCLSLRKEIGKHKSFGERPHMDGCSEK